MASYRLLRSNKESGPYSLNDLVTLGLKPYDLVWVDGRSAAWRYPSEVAELKDFAPAVEEQPYDRFYKKPSETEVQKESPVTRQQEVPQATPIKAPVVFSQSETFQPNSVKETAVYPQPEIVQPKNPIKETAVYSQPEIIQPRNTVNEDIVKEEPIKNPAIEAPNHSYPQYQPQQKKQVFVSMPENNGFNPYQQEVKRQEVKKSYQPEATQTYSQETKQSYSQEAAYQQYLPKSKPVQEKQIPVEKPYTAPKEKSYSPIDIHEPDETKLETKYTQSLDDIKEMYINTLVQRKTRNRRKEIFRKYVKPALAPLLLIIFGVALGYVITFKRSSSPAAVESVSQVVPQQNVPEQKNEQSTDEVTDNTTTDSKITDNKILQPHSLVTNNRKASRSVTPQQQQATVMYQKQNKNARVPKAVVPERKERETFIPDNEVVRYQKKDVQVDPTTGERTRAIRDNDEIVTRESNPKNNSERYSKKSDPEPNFIEEDDHRSIRDFVTIKNNNYIRGAFGGIKGLELTIYNRSAFLVDEVSIELQIMKPSEQPLRTDVITVRNISANGAVTIKVPDSQRGIRVDYRITNVESKQWQKSTAGL